MGGTTADRKAALRQELKARRAHMAPEERSVQDAAIAAELLATEAWQKARAVLPYVSFGAEVDTRCIIEAAWRSQKLVAVPRVVAGERRMRWFAISNFERFERSALGVEEPAIDAHAEVFPDELVSQYGAAGVLAVVPGLAFDEEGYRLGYGGGFYDVFLRAFGGTSIGLCRRGFLYGRLAERDAFDVPVQHVIVPRAQ